MTSLSLATLLALVFGCCGTLALFGSEFQPNKFCKTTKPGAEYSGTLSVTKSGRTCQVWTTQVPHRHDYTSKNGYKFPDGNEKYSKNYCRNPDSSSIGPWCYTTDPKVRYESCGVYACDELFRKCKATKGGEEYIGTLSVTKNNRTCQAWGSQTPHSHSMTAAKGYIYPDGDEVKAKNYCRNPGGSGSTPWCYTTDPKVKWEACDIVDCDDAAYTCKLTPKGTEYIGTRSTTKTGQTCQDWSSQIPHKHSITVEYVEAANYCRNPDGYSGGPWCYTANPKMRWDVCDIPSCGGA